MKFTKTLIAASLAVVSADSFAAAFQLAEQNVSGLGRAYAGEAAVADDASVLAMDREELMEEFMIAYQDTLMEIGLDNREIARMAMAAIA